MIFDGCGDYHRIEPGAVEHVVEVHNSLDLWKEGLHMYEPLCIQIAHQPHITLWQGTKVPNEVWPPVSAARYSNTKRFWHFFRLQVLMCSYEAFGTSIGLFAIGTLVHHCVRALKAGQRLARASTAWDAKTGIVFSRIFISNAKLSFCV